MAILILAGGFVWQRASARPGPVNLSYEVTLVDPAAEQLAVDLTLEGLGGESVILGFSANALASDAPVRKFRLRRAIDGEGKELPISRDRGLWQVDKTAPVVTVTYEVFLREGRPKSEFAAEALSRCDARSARLLGSDVFLFPNGRDTQSIRAAYHLPAGWKLFHPFQVDATTAEYPELESLYYSVVAAGDYRTLERNVSGLQLTLAIRGHYQFGDHDLMDVVSRICRHQVEFFAGAPRDRYLIIVDSHPDGDDPDQLHYFGLHFDASMSVQLDERTDRRRLQAEPAHILAHEFFHNWNGELIEQRGYEMNWFIEGVTTYYSYQTRLALRMLDNGRYAEDLQRRFKNNYLDNPERSRVSPAQAGQEVLQTQDLTRLLYTGGLFLAVALNAEIGFATGQERNLNDLMLALADRARTDPAFVLTREALEGELALLTGQDFSQWMSRHVYGTEVPQLPEYVLAR